MGAQEYAYVEVRRESWETVTVEIVLPSHRLPYALSRHPPVLNAQVRVYLGVMVVRVHQYTIII